MNNNNAIKRTQQLLADLQGCVFDLSARRSLKVAVRRVLGRHSVKVLRSGAHEFSNHGMTLFYILAESHLAVHTWPEKNLVNIDLFLCNYTRNNNHKARAVVRSLIELLKPVKVTQHKITRLN